MKFFVFRLFSLISYLFFLRSQPAPDIPIQFPPIHKQVLFQKSYQILYIIRDTVAEHLYPKEMSFGSVTSCKSDICLEIVSIFVARNHLFKSSEDNFLILFLILCSLGIYYLTVEIVIRIIIKEPFYVRMEFFGNTNLSSIILISCVSAKTSDGFDYIEENFGYSLMFVSVANSGYSFFAFINAVRLWITCRSSANFQMNLYIFIITVCCFYFSQ